MYLMTILMNGHSLIFIRTLYETIVSFNIPQSLLTLVFCIQAMLTK
jgi:hypothetical protein